jgi:two-component system, NarL family, sensor kinase
MPGSRLVSVLEREWRCLALDIHDEPLQQAIMLGRALGEAGAPVEWRQAVRDIVDSLRAICAQSQPSPLRGAGLESALAALLAEARQRTSVQVTYDVTGLTDTDGRLPWDVELALYRVAQGAISNCLRHADATCVQLRLARTPRTVELCVRDNGRGFGLRQQRGQAPSLGLASMHERMRGIGGRLLLGGGPGNGTCVRAIAPLIR